MQNFKILLVYYFYNVLKFTRYLDIHADTSLTLILKACNHQTNI